MLLKRKRTWFAGPLALVAALVLTGVMTMAGGDTPARALTNCTVSDNTFDQTERDFLTLINNYRAQQTAIDGISRPALIASVNLNRAATWHAADMGTKNYFSHTDSLGRAPGTRAVQCDFTGGSNTVGENIAAGYPSAQAVFDGWKGSPGHNSNMLSGAYRMIGIGRVVVSGSTYGTYWVTPFSTFNDGTNASTGGGGTNPTPTPTQPGGGFPTPTRTATPAPTQPAGSGAVVQSPAPGSRLPGSSVTFSWSGVSGAYLYGFFVGSTPGGSQYGSAYLSTTSRTVSGLPTDGRTIYVRLITYTTSGGTFTRDSTFLAALSGGGGGGFPTATPTLPGGGGFPTPTRTPTAAPTQPAGGVGAITAPAPGSVIRGGTAQFRWNPGPAGTMYLVDFGTTAGGTQMGRFYVSSNVINVSGLPTDGRTIYVKVWVFGASGGGSASYTTGP